MIGRDVLEQAMKSAGPVRVYREGLDDGWIDGFVVGCGPQFFVMAVLDKAVRLDGYNCMRYSDVNKCENPAPFTDFIGRALRVHGQTPECPGELSAPDLRQILQFASRRFGLITIEDENPDTAFIGKVRFISDSFLQMILIGPDAEWDPEPAEFAFDEIHRVDFGGAYEQTLLTVAKRD